MMPRSHRNGGAFRHVTRIARAVCSLALLLPAVCSHASTLSYPDFSTTAGLSLNGNAYQLGSLLRLTNADFSQRAGAWSSGKVLSSGGFTTTFTFQLSSEAGPSGHGADGLTFNVQNDGNNITAGEGGGGTGPDDALSIGIDTFQGDPSTEPSDNYVKIVGNSQTVLATQDLTPLGINVHDDQPHTVAITYDGANLTVTVDGKAVFTNFAAPLGTAADANGLSYVGFGARTGGYYQNTDILSWTYNAVPNIGGIGLGGAFKYADFSTVTDLKILGSAAQNASLLTLTPNQGGQTGAAWYDLREPVGKGFDTTFVFQVTAQANGADGLAFTVSTDGFLTGSENGSSGGDSIGVGIDTYQNTGEPSNNFVKIVGNNQVVVATQDLTPLGINVHDGAPHIVAVHYDGANISVTVDTQSVISSTPLPLGSAVLADGTALVGLTARTGGVSEEHDIVSWSFTPGGAPAVTGRIALEGVTDLTLIKAAVPADVITFDFRTPGTKTVVYSTTATLTAVGAGSAFGKYSLSGVPAGTYDVAIKGDKQLRVLLPNVTVGSGTTLANVTLPGGDATNDNTVDIGDFGVLVNSYNGDITLAGSGYNATSDFNYDGVVDIGDFGILVNEYNNSGAP